MRIAALVLPLLAFLTWASWPAPFPPLDPEDAEALCLLRDLERGRVGAWEAIVRARNPRTVPALMLRGSDDCLYTLLHHPELTEADLVVIPPPRLACCRYGQKLHPPADAFERALQAEFLESYNDGDLKQRSCARSGCSARFELEERLDDSEPGVRFAAAVQLWRNGDLHTFRRVRGMLGAHAFARYPWLEAVDEFFREERSEAWIRAIARAGHERGLAAAAFLKLKPAVEDIVQLLNDPAKRESWPDAAWALGEIGDSAATAMLIEALSRGDYFLTGDAAEALAKIGDRSAVPALRGALDRAGVYGQAEILRALGTLGGPEDVSHVEYYATTDEYAGAIGRRRVAEDVLRHLRP